MGTQKKGPLPNQLISTSTADPGGYLPGHDCHCPLQVSELSQGLSTWTPWSHPHLWSHMGSCDKCCEQNTRADTRVKQGEPAPRLCRSELRTEGRTQHTEKTYKVGNVCRRVNVPWRWHETKGCPLHVGWEGRKAGVRDGSSPSLFCLFGFNFHGPLRFLVPTPKNPPFCPCLWLAARVPCSSPVLHCSWLHF